MKANELRIGNRLNHNDGHNIGAFIVELVHIDDIVRNNEYAKQYEPIPLSEEWLVRFGFKNIDKGDNDYITYTDPNHDYYLQIDVRRKDGKYSILDNSFDDLRAFSMVDIKYVHQLQNLYFALTGNELKYEEQS